ncbi:hydroxyectoine utilization dehydratase EutB [Paracoccus sp. 1_MG-2023]|uniref:hydroxyectoine utilization dehydratase EutB n=1 Tax=unclassified Paracoccus (in: a-proteobacteria) TaxID=2688777 RepID=UPI001C08F939|nr:hydroxyectoine utilization dehydratase EutB [Paracoccus sp. 1_MG-2023]MBU2958613.1 hydroxyectoine utilization dehydratase EutB [Paracoccus sp. C2R09]MDO6667606.1 hydroxyectoine utilization dehydratase EutB [Paracoccus sp. 1_MG-2023]
MVGLEDILAARDRIAGQVLETPVAQSIALGERAGVPVWLKLEHRQTTGAFKLRGATNAVMRLGRVAGVTTASTGNHGRALAHAARQAGTPAVICMSSLVPQNKLDAIRDLGAEARIVGDSQDDAFHEARRLKRDEGFALIPPFDHPDVIAGQGTLGLELLEQVPDAATVAIPLSGGGLLAGVAAALKARRPDIRIVGISMERGAAMAASLAAGHPVEVRELPTLADSLGGGIGLQNRLTFAMVRKLMDDLILLPEDDIAAGIRHLAAEGHVVEGAAAVGAGAILSGRLVSAGPVVLVVSGANIDPAAHAAILRGAP